MCLTQASRSSTLQCASCNTASEHLTCPACACLCVAGYHLLEVTTDTSLKHDKCIVKYDATYANSHPKLFEKCTITPSSGATTWLSIFVDYDCSGAP